MADIVYFLDTLMNVLANGVEATMIYEIQNPKDDNVFKISSPSVVLVKFLAKNKPSNDVLKSAPVKLSTKQTKLIRERAVDFVNNAPAQEVLKSLIEHTTELVRTGLYSQMVKLRNRVLEYLYNEAERIKEEAEEELDDTLSEKIISKSFDIKLFVRRVRLILKLKNAITRDIRKLKKLKNSFNLEEFKSGLKRPKLYATKICESIKELLEDFKLGKSVISIFLADKMLKVVNTFEKYVYHKFIKNIIRRVRSLLKSRIKKAVKKAVSKALARAAATHAVAAVIGTSVAGPAGTVAAEAAATVVDVGYAAYMVYDFYDAYTNFKNTVALFLVDFSKKVGEMLKELINMSLAYELHMLQLIENRLNLFEATRDMTQNFGKEVIYYDANLYNTSSFKTERDDKGVLRFIDLDKETPNQLFYKFYIVFDELINTLESGIAKYDDEILKLVKKDLSDVQLPENIEKMFKVKLNIKKNKKRKIQFKRILNGRSLDARGDIGDYHKNIKDTLVYNREILSILSLGEGKELNIGDILYKRINPEKLKDADEAYRERAKKEHEEAEERFHKVDEMIYIKLLSFASKAQLEEKRANAVITYADRVDELLKSI